MKRHHLTALAIVSLSVCGLASAQDAPAVPQITMGNGANNAIQIEGLARSSDVTSFSQVRVDGDAMSSFRADSTAITFPEVTIERNGWLVLHPVIDGRPNGDMVSGFSYLETGTHSDVTIKIDHPADPGDKFLVMLHGDVDEDKVFDFVFVEDGINVEDTAIFEGTQMIAHVFAVPD